MKGGLPGRSPFFCVKIKENTGFQKCATNECTASVGFEQITLIHGDKAGIRGRMGRKSILKAVYI